MTGSNQLFFRVAAVSTLGSNLLGYWPLAGDARDISGHGYHGIATNLVWTTNRLATSNASALFVNNPQQWANAFAHVAISNAPGLCPTNSLSVTAWFNTFDPLGRHIVSKEFNSGMEDSFVLWFEFGTALRFQIEVTNSFANVGIVSPPTDGQWHFVAGTWDGQWIKIYLDGIPRDTNWLTGGMVWDDHPIRIGADDNNGDYIADEGWDGLINEVRIYGRALSDDEVRQIYLLPW